MGTVSEQQSATAVLTAPAVSGTAAGAMDDLRGQCGILGTVDGVIAWITGFSPLEQWVFKPLAGDWTALDRGGAAWANAGDALAIVAKNLNSFPSQVGNGFEGQAALEWANSNGKLSAKINELPEKCQQLSQMCAALSEAAQGLAQLIAMLLAEISELVAELLPQLAIPVEGEVALGVYGTRIGIKVGVGSAKIAERIAKFTELVGKIQNIIAMVQQILSVLSTMADVLGNVSKAYDAGTKASSPVAWDNGDYRWNRGPGAPTPPSSANGPEGSWNGDPGGGGSFGPGTGNGGTNGGTGGGSSPTVNISPNFSYTKNDDHSIHLGGNGGSGDSSSSTHQGQPAGSGHSEPGPSHEPTHRAPRIPRRGRH